MVRFWKQWWTNQSLYWIDLQRNPKTRFWASNQNGTSAVVEMPVYRKELKVCLQWPIDSGSPSTMAATGIRRRGGKRQLHIALPLEQVQLLHAALGKALEEAALRARERQLLEIYLVAALEVSQKYKNS